MLMRHQIEQSVDKKSRKNKLDGKHVTIRLGLLLWGISYSNKSFVVGIAIYI